MNKRKGLALVIAALLAAMSGATARAQGPVIPPIFGEFTVVVCPLPDPRGTTHQISVSGRVENFLPGDEVMVAEACLGYTGLVGTPVALDESGKFAYSWDADLDPKTSGCRVHLVVGLIIRGYDVVGERAEVFVTEDGVILGHKTFVPNIVK